MAQCFIDIITFGCLFSVKGTWFLEEGLLSDTITPAQVLGRLQHFRFVSRDNVHLLQALVVRLDDSDLYGEAVRYIRHHHGTVYFYPELEQLRMYGFEEINTILIYYLYKCLLKNTNILHILCFQNV